MSVFWDWIYSENPGRVSQNIPTMTVVVLLGPKCPPYDSVKIPKSRDSYCGKLVKKACKNVQTGGAEAKVVLTVSLPNENPVPIG
jgi:hypothetical protein